MELTDRDLEVIEVALESAISACVGFVGVNNDSTDKLATEYQQALTNVQRMSEERA